MSFRIVLLLTCLITTHSPANHLPLSSAPIEVAITFDDLPFQSATKPNQQITSKESVEVTKKIVHVLKKYHIPSTWGVVNAKVIRLHPDMTQSLKIWLRSGNRLGNHTYSHSDLAKVTSDQFITDIIHNASLLKKIAPNETGRVFRYPFLAYGNTQNKYDTVRDYLIANDYKIAYVTMDFFDSEWSTAYRRCLKMDNRQALQWLKKSFLQQSLNAITIARSLSHQLFHRDIKYILLLHISDIQADVLNQLLTQYEKRGVKFVSLEPALADPVYQADPKIYRDRAYTLLNRIRLSRSLPNPKIVSDLYATLPEEKLAIICQ